MPVSPPSAHIGRMELAEGWCKARAQFLSLAVEHSRSPSTDGLAGGRGGRTFASHQSKSRLSLDPGCSVLLCRSWAKGAVGNSKAIASPQPLHLRFIPI